MCPVFLVLQFPMYSVFSTVLSKTTVLSLYYTSTADVSSAHVPCSPVLHVLCVLNCSIINYSTVTIIHYSTADVSSVPCSPVLHVLRVLLYIIPLHGQLAI